MIRNIRVFGFALVAAMAMSSLASSAAQAIPTVEVSEPAILLGTASEAPVWASGSRTIKCAEAGISTTLTSNTSELTVDPGEHACTASFFGVRPATFTSNHCEYTFQNMTTAGTSWTATVDILCENPGEEMEIHVYENALKHKENVSLCTVKIPPQQDLGTVVFSNMAASEPADITINFTLSKMQFNVSGSILICGMSSSNATYNGIFTMHAENLKGKPIPLTISGE
jgi:hypothetical protein